MAELHVVGEVHGSTGFGGRNVFCKVRLPLSLSLSSQSPSYPDPPNPTTCPSLPHAPRPPLPLPSPLSPHPPPSPSHLPSSPLPSPLFLPPQWTLVNGPGWDVIEGLPQGQTHVDYPGDADDAVWSHPMDLHLACKTLSGWPKLSLEVWSLDGAGRADIAGYGFCHIPGAPGRHEISCPMWVPTGSDLGRFKSFFIGGNPRLKVRPFPFLFLSSFFFSFSGMGSCRSNRRSGHEKECRLSTGRV